MAKASLPPYFISIAEAAAVLGISRAAVYHAVDSDRLQVHDYQGKSVLLRAGLRRQFFNSSQQKCNSLSLLPKGKADDLSAIVQKLLADNAEFEAFAEAMAELLADQLNPELWGPQRWPAWKWATVLIATDRAVSRLNGES